MRIKELSERSGLSRDTIRYYEKIGLLKLEKGDRSENNYKEYSEIHLNRLLLIKQAKKMGVTLKQIHEYIQAWEDGLLSKKEQMTIFQQQLDYLNQQIADMQKLKDNVLMKMEKLENGEVMQIGETPEVA